MFEQDYLVRMLIELAAAIRRSFERAHGKKDDDGAAATLENSIGAATDLDGSVLLSLSPESIASVLQVANTDPRVVIYIAHSMQLLAHYLRKSGKNEVAELRDKQAKALADAYNFELPENIEQVDDEDFNEDEFIESIDKLCEA